MKAFSMKMFIILSIILFLNSCGSSVYDRLGNLICENREDCGVLVPDLLEVPYDDEKFSKILENSRLHYPDNQTDVDYGEFDGFVTSYFYLDDTLLTFQLDKQNHGKLRSELRLGPDNWMVSENEAHILRASVKCYGSEELSKYTFM